MTIDVKHYEECEQLFLTVGESFTVEALLHFFGMETKDSPVTQNSPPYYILVVGDQKEQYYNKFIDEFLLKEPTRNGDESDPDDKHFVRNYLLLVQLLSSKK